MNVDWSFYVEKMCLDGRRISRGRCRARTGLLLVGLVGRVGWLGGNSLVKICNSRLAEGF